MPVADDLASSLRAALDLNGFDAAGVDRILGPEVRAQVARGDLAVAARRLCDESPLVTLVRLFVAGLPSSGAAASRALAPMELEAAVDAGLVSVEGVQAHPQVMLQPIGDLVIASDVRSRRDRPDFVMQVSSTTVALAGLTIRRPVEAALDIGCGSGFQALLAARHSARVSAFDANPRAIEYARLNARLNGLGTVSFEGGALFAPLPDGQFALIVSTPPFVISPGLGHQFRDSGLEGDAVCRHLA